MTVGSLQQAPTSDDGYTDVVAGLRATFDSGRTRSYEWRARQLDGLARLMDEREEDVVDALVADLRRTPFEASLFDLAATKGELRHARKHLRRWMRPRRVPAPMSAQPGRAWYQFEPLGVTLIIAPWNYPIHLALTPLIGALAAGNCAVIKPSEITPQCSALLADLLPQYVDPEAVAVVEGGAEASIGLLGQRVDHCFFTGSPAVGSAIMAAAAPHLTPVTLELGGKCPVIVTSSARLDIAARRIAFGKLANSGQTCVAPDYVLVDRRVRDEFVAVLTDTVRRFSEARSVPIVNDRHAARIAGLLEAPGGEVVLGGTVDVAEAQAEPTIIVDPTPGTAILQEEIFGPVLPVVTVDSLDEAIAHVRRGSRPLASYLFTEDRNDERRVLDSVITGGLVVNHVMLHLTVNELPFGGVGTSGMGRYHGHWGFETFSNPKAVLRKRSRPDITLFYPPYSDRAKRIMNRML
jgi:aldehyde dehydrogenase (NAD+)